MLKIQLPRIRTVRDKLGHNPLDDRLIDAKPLQEWIAGHGLCYKL